MLTYHDHFVFIYFFYSGTVRNNRNNILENCAYFLNMLGYFLFHIGAVLDVCKEDKSLESAHAFLLI